MRNPGDTEMNMATTGYPSNLTLSTTWSPLISHGTNDHHDEFDSLSNAACEAILSIWSRLKFRIQRHDDEIYVRDQQKSITSQAFK
jgi:hypothetical protein